MNVQLLADPAGRLLWASPALPGAVHDIRAGGLAALKTWRLLRKIRCSTTRITSLVQAVLTLRLDATDRG